MNTSERAPSVHQDEIDVVGAWLIIWRHKFVVAAIAVAVVVLAVIYALTATPIYRAVVVVTPVRDTGSGAASQLLGQFGGLASLAGLNFGGKFGQDTEHEATLESRHLVDEFMRQPGVFNEYKRRFKKNTETVWTAVENFRGAILNVKEDKLKDITTVTVDWTDPGTAANFANAIVALANNLIRDRARAESSRNIDYLNKQLQTTTVIDIQRVLYGLIEQETKTLMLANGRPEYAFTIVDPAVAPELRTSPKRTLIVLAGGFLGILLGSLFVLAREKIRRRTVPA